VIVRIMGEGQWQVPDDLHTLLDEHDGRALEALQRGDEAELDGVLEEMASLVRSRGTPLPPDDLSPSDAVIPPTDLTLEETRELFEGEGLIPDLPRAE
jgi:hypothetical protein